MLVQRFWRWLIAAESGGLRDLTMKQARNVGTTELFKLTSIGLQHGRGNVVALALAATALGMAFVGAILPTPLYPLYQREFGFSGVTLTLVYAVYVLGNLVALLFFGRLSDQIGRRIVSLPAVGVAIAGAVVFAAASSTPWLFAARALSGVSTGLASGTATAWLAELYTGSKSGAAARIA